MTIINMTMTITMTLFHLDIYKKKSMYLNEYEQFKVDVMATTLCSHNSALFNVRSRLKAKLGWGGVEWVCLQRPTPCISSLPVDSLPVDSPPCSRLSFSRFSPKCAHSQKRLMVGLLLHVSQNTCIAKVDASQNTVIL